MNHQPDDDPLPAELGFMRNFALPALCITLLSLVLASGFEMLGLLAPANRWLTQTMARGLDLPNELPVWLPWAVKLAMVFGFSLAILTEKSQWKRIIIALTAVFSMASWLPVMVLAAYRIDLAAPLVSIAWAVFGACIYAARHFPNSNR